MNWLLNAYSYQNLHEQSGRRLVLSSLVGPVTGESLLPFEKHPNGAKNHCKHYG